jgi:putative hydrolase of the HAD superfamily
MPINAVLFDLDDTLYDREALVRRVVTDQYDAFSEDLRSVPKADFVARVTQLDDHGYADKRALYTTVVAEWRLTPDLVERLAQNFWTSYDEKCFLPEDTRLTLQMLRRNGIKLGVITNGGAERQQRKLDSLGISSWFDVILISETEGVRKPDVEIFHRALSRCGVEPSEAIFVGDHPDTDVGGALQAGLCAVWKVTPYWPCAYDVPFVRRLSEILPMCDGGDRVSYVLRHATEADLPLMYRTHCLGLGPYITQIRGWDEAREHEYFLRRFSATECQTILVEGELAGWFRTEDNADHFCLDYIVLAPEHQRKGIGGQIVMDLLRRARERGVPLKLNVLRVNPAKTLYERLGFREVGGDEHRFFMEA